MTVVLSASPGRNKPGEAKGLLKVPCFSHLCVLESGRLGFMSWFCPLCAEWLWGSPFLTKPQFPHL